MSTLMSNGSNKTGIKCFSLIKSCFELYIMHVAIVGTEKDNSKRKIQNVEQTRSCFFVFKKLFVVVVPYQHTKNVLKFVHMPVHDARGSTMVHAHCAWNFRIFEKPVSFSSKYGVSFCAKCFCMPMPIMAVCDLL
jgi:hypothetical protein